MVEVRTASQVIVISDDEEEQSLSRPVKKTFATQSAVPSKRPSDAADVAPAPRRQRRTSKAMNVGKGIPDCHHSDRENTKHDDGIGSNMGHHRPMIPPDQQNSRESTRLSASLPKKQKGPGKRLKADLQDLGQSRQAADRSMQLPSNRTTKPRPFQSPSQHSPMQRQQQQEQQQQQQQEQQQPSHGIHSNVSTNLERGPGQPQSMPKYSLQGPEIPSMEPRLQRIKDIKDLLGDYDDDNKDLQLWLHNCNGTGKAEHYLYVRKLQKNKQEQKELRRELQSLEEAVSVYDVFLIM
ncbi:MAG: hypothetical protein Q9192_006410, partial [Flavoplaca navasiana]